MRPARQLRKLGVTSVDDLEQLEQKNVDLGRSPTTRSTTRAGQPDREVAPRPEPAARGTGVACHRRRPGPCLLDGANLRRSALPAGRGRERGLAEVMSSSDRRVRIQLDRRPPPRETTKSS